MQFVKLCTLLNSWSTRSCPHFLDISSSILHTNFKLLLKRGEAIVPRASGTEIHKYVIRHDEETYNELPQPCRAGSLSAAERHLPASSFPFEISRLNHEIGL